MTEQERYDIPAEYREAFRFALWAYDAWIDDPRTNRLEAQMCGKLFSVEFICNVVEKFNDTMPDDQHGYLCKAAHQHTGETVAAPDDHSYAAGAKCLRALVVYKKHINKCLGRD